MTDKNSPLSERSQDQQEDMIAQLRSKVEEAEESAPALKKSFWAPKEISARRSPWLVRGVIVILALAVIVEFFVIMKYQEERELAGFEGGPAVETYPAPPEPEIPPLPEDEDPALPEELLIADAGGEVDSVSEDDLLPEPPTPTPIPLPDGVEEVPFPTPDT